MNNKKKWFASLVAGLTLLIAGCATLPPTPTTGDIPPQIVAWAHQNVWKVNRPPGGHGSGFWINDTQLITACHVVNGLESATVTSADFKDTIINVNVLSCDVDKDIAILERDFTLWGEFETDPTYIAYNSVKEGHTVYGAGYPLWWPLTINKGHYGVEMTSSLGFIRYSNSVPTMMGDSGSPLLSLRKGRVYIEGVRLSVAGIQERFSNVYVTHMAMSASGRQVLEELREMNLAKQKKGR